MSTAFRHLCRRLGAWLLRVGEARPTAWAKLRGLDTDTPAALRVRQHLWRRIARELGHRAPTLGTSM